MESQDYGHCTWVKNWKWQLLWSLLISQKLEGAFRRSFGEYSESDELASTPANQTLKNEETSYVFCIFAAFYYEIFCLFFQTKSLNENF